MIFNYRIYMQHFRGIQQEKVIIDKYCNIAGAISIVKKEWLWSFIEMWSYLSSISLGSNYRKLVGGINNEFLRKFSLLCVIVYAAFFFIVWISAAADIVGYCYGLVHCWLLAFRLRSESAMTIFLYLKQVWTCLRFRIYRDLRKY